MDSPIRTVRIIARLNVGGPARHVVWLTEAQNDAAFETTLVTGVVPPGEEDMTPFAAAHGVHPLVIAEMSREISPADVVTIWKLYRLFLRSRPEVIDTHTAKAGTAGRVAGFLYRWLTLSTLRGRPRRVRFVHTFHGHIFSGYYGRAKTAIFLAIERLLARMTDVIIVLSERQLEEIAGTYRVGRRAQYRIVPLGLDFDEVSADAASGARLRDELRIDADAFVIVLAGRLTAIKNVELFLRGAARALQENAALRFVVFGDGTERMRLERAAEAMGIAHSVRFAGTRPAATIYGTANAVALTSLNEGTPMTLLEAMANGLPMISTAVGGVKDLAGPSVETIGDATLHERGITVETGDEAALAYGFLRLAGDPSLRTALGQRGRAWVLQAHSKERLVADILGLTRELARSD